MNGPVAVPSEEMRPGIGEKRDTLRPTLKQRGGAVEYHIFPSSPHLLEPSVLPALSLDELQSLVISLASALADSRASLERERKLVGVLERALEEQGATLGDLEREELARGGEEIEEEGEWRIPVVIAGGRGKFAMDEVCPPRCRPRLTTYTDNTGPRRSRRCHFGRNLRCDIPHFEIHIGNLNFQLPQFCFNTVGNGGTLFRRG